ncbi:hypothetical protein EON81_12865 [bacterium]|nr:MAG: hypothetical protein EON81_12865 [bacterium]
MQRTMSPEEAQAVVQLQLERGGDLAGISVEEVASTLNVSREQVEILLNEVRHRQKDFHAQAVADHRRRDMRRVALAFVFATLLVVGGVGFSEYRRMARWADNARPSIPVAPELTGMSVAAPKIPDEMMVAPMGMLPQIRLISGNGASAIDVAGRSLEQVVASVEEYMASERSSLLRSPAADKATREALLNGTFLDPGIGLVPGVLFVEDDKRTFNLPQYTGADAEAEALAVKARLKIIADAMRVPPAPN